MKPLFALFLALFPLALSAAEEKPTKGIDIDMVSENLSVKPGEPFTVGVKIHHHEGFHTYWQNPGVAGVPVKLEWHLPDGFAAGEIQWPYPEKTKMAIHPVHGFERDVMLLVQITPTAKLPDARLELKATASWMACADGCYPGKKELSAQVNIGGQTKPDPALVSAFVKARAEIPQDMTDWSAEAASLPDATEIRIRLIPHLGALPPTDLYFFSSDGQVSSDRPQRLEKTADGFELIAERSPYGPKSGESLSGVLVSSTPFGKSGATFVRISPTVKRAPAAIPAQAQAPEAAPAPKCECEE